MDDRARIKARIKAHEGLRLTPYEDSRGVLTVGYGHNQHTQISVSTAEYLFEADYAEAETLASEVFSDGWSSLSDVRLGVLIEMAFQLGDRIREFTRFRVAISRSDYEAAAREMIDSEWHKETPTRAEILASIIRSDSAG